MNDNGRVLACGHEICFGMTSAPFVALCRPTSDYFIDCLLDLRNSPIAHDGILYVSPLIPTSQSWCNLFRSSGYGNEKQNLEAEKEYENAVAKGFRPCLSLSLSSPSFCC
jgi:hypothetical protein